MNKFDVSFNKILKGMWFKIPLQIHKNVYILTLFNMKIANTYKKFSFACQVLLSFSTFLYISYRIY